MDDHQADLPPSEGPSQEPSFGSDSDGLRSAAAELKRTREETTELDRRDRQPDPATMPTFQSQDNPPPIDEIICVDPETQKPLPDEVTRGFRESVRGLADYHRAADAVHAEAAAQAAEQPAEVSSDTQPIEQPVEQPRPPAPADPVQQLEQFRQGLAAQEQADLAQLEQLRALFPDYARATTVEQLQRLAESNPERDKLYRMANAEAGRLQRELQQINQAKSASVEQLQRAQRQQYESWIRSENDKVDAQIPATERERLGREVVQMLAERGITRDNIDDPQYRLLRSAESQLILAEHARLRLQQRAQQEGAKRLSAHQRPVPPVVRPGVAPAHPRDGRHAADIERLQHAVDAARSPQAAIKAAVELRKAQRAAR